MRFALPILALASYVLALPQGRRANVIPSTIDPSIATQILNIANSRGVTETVMLSMFETAFVESHVNNLNFGDRDSLGVFQQRTQFFKDPTNVNTATNAYLDQAIRLNAKNPSIPAGVLAQDVQKSGFPQRYTQAEPQASLLLALTRAGNPAAFNKGTAAAKAALQSASASHSTSAAAAKATSPNLASPSSSASVASSSAAASNGTDTDTGSSSSTNPGDSSSSTSSSTSSTNPDDGSSTSSSTSSTNPDDSSSTTSSSTSSTNADDGSSTNVNDGSSSISVDDGSSSTNFDDGSSSIVNDGSSTSVDGGSGSTNLDDGSSSIVDDSSSSSTADLEDGSSSSGFGDDAGVDDGSDDGFDDGDFRRRCIRGRCL